MQMFHMKNKINWKPQTLGIGICHDRSALAMSDDAINLVKIVWYEVRSENSVASTSSRKVFGSDGASRIENSTGFVDWMPCLCLIM